MKEQLGIYQALLRLDALQSEIKAEAVSIPKGERIVQKTAEVHWTAPSVDKLREWKRQAGSPYLDRPRYR